ncbi:non-canonical purine NTP pyrophosphatase [Candidatus Woesearchaeota archaeon]|nr:non-canonical purine NTP pyrophosphatase [Candidatus Woesearchaeota archaeon]
MEILFASGNKGKLEEFQFVADKFGYPAKIVSVYDKFPKIKPYSEEHGSSEEIVKNGANEIFDNVKIPVVVEESSVEINAFGKGPGPKTNKYMKEKKVSGLLEEMKEKLDRKATITSILAYNNGSKIQIMKNSVDGHIAEKSSKGEGINAVFFHPKKKKTFAEMAPEEFLAHGYSGQNFKLVLKHIFGY